MSTGYGTTGRKKTGVATSLSDDFGREIPLVRLNPHYPKIDRLQIQREHVEDQIDSASKVASKKRTIKPLEDTVRALIRKTIRLNRQREALLATSAGELNRQGVDAVQSCRSNKRFRSALSWSLGVAPTCTSTPDTRDNHNSTGTAVWNRLLSPSRTAAS
ncbi:MAG: hypothetical protein A2X58_10810 [Nitrospirae bacterium GWC2_56_14]|nr:MAG: hypothetical protein A2X58_10810 [Nitrospirae bacterium GWC2_56_14]